MWEICSGLSCEIALMESSGGTALHSTAITLLYDKRRRVCYGLTPLVVVKARGLSPRFLVLSFFFRVNVGAFYFCTLYTHQGRHRDACPGARASLPLVRGYSPLQRRLEEKWRINICPGNVNTRGHNPVELNNQVWGRISSRAQIYCF